MNRYETYKDSGIPWLGEVPEHWDKIAVHYLVNLKSGNSITALDLVENGEYPVFGGGGFRGYINTFTHCGKFNLIGRQGALCGNVTLVNGKFFATEHAIVVTPIKNVDTKWFYYLLITMNLNQYSTSAAQPGISAEVIGRLRVLLPSYEEQIAIAHYLDTKLGEIDALIDKQQTLLEKLAEQRTAVITQAVTKGLNPAAPMKNSGVKWLGDVPAHWQLINLKFLCRVKGGYAFSSDNFSDDGIPVIRISDILFDGTVDNINCKRIPLELAPNQKDFELRNGQLVMAMTGATIGKISKYSSEDYAYINQRVGKFEAFNSRLNYAFLYHLLNTSGYQEHIKLTAFGGAQPNISDSEMVNYQMALPTMEEQANIADYLYQEAAKIDRLCDTVNQTIGRLKEYRTALITQAVTGKIKVTNE